MEIWLIWYFLDLLELILEWESPMVMIQENINDCMRMIWRKHHNHIAIMHGILDNSQKCVQIIAGDYNMNMESYCMIKYANYISISWTLMQLPWILSHYQLFARHWAKQCVIFLHWFIENIFIRQWQYDCNCNMSRTSRLDFEGFRPTKRSRLPKGNLQFMGLRPINWS